MTRGRAALYLLSATVISALTFYLVTGSSSPITYYSLGHHMEAIDFKSLDFTCSREEDHVSKPTAKAEELFLTARQIHVRATSDIKANETLMKEAIRGYERAAEAGHWKAVRNLATIYTAGVGQGPNVVIQPDSTLALRYTWRLIDMKVATGFNLMAVFANEGWGVKRNQNAALTYQRRAADLGSRDAQRQLGNKFYREFNDLPKDERARIKNIGLKILACALMQGDKEAASDLAAKYEVVEENYPYTLFYYQQGGKMGDATCLYALYEWFKEGKHGYSVERDRAQKYYDYKKRADVREGPFPDLDNVLPLPPAPNGATYPPPEAGWPNAWTQL